MISEKMTRQELGASLSLASIYALRMFGLFVILPVFALYAPTLPGGNNHLLVGLALGAYAATQCLLQLPFGMLSDRYGRKRMIYIGLILFALGNLVAAQADHIGWIIAGRALQGAGAMSAAVMALVADLTREEHRTKAMATIGGTIGLTFFLSLILSPVLYHHLGMPGIFTLTALLAGGAMLVVRFLVPDPGALRFHSDAEANPAKLRTVLRDPELLRLNVGVFSLHAAQMALFLVMPLILVQAGGLASPEHWKVYLPVAAGSFLLAIPLIVLGESRDQLKAVFLGAVGLMLVTQTAMAFRLDSLWEIVLLLLCYFMAFNLLEAMLPSLISKIAPAGSKGTAIGVYNASQSLGAFVGPAAGGYLASQIGPHAVFLLCGGLMLIWLLTASGMRTPPPVATKAFRLPERWQGDATALTQRLLQVPGVTDAVVVADEQAAYLKVTRRGWDQAAVERLIQENA